MAQDTATATTTDQVRTSTIAIGVPNAAINATCITVHLTLHTLTQVALIAASGTPMAIVLVLIWSVVVVVAVAASHSYLP